MIEYDVWLECISLYKKELKLTSSSVVLVLKIFTAFAEGTREFVAFGSPLKALMSALTGIRLKAASALELHRVGHSGASDI